MRAKAKKRPEVNEQETAQPVSVRIAQITKDRDFQMRARLDGGTVKRYVDVYRSERLMPPVTLAHVDGMLILVDGWHRLAALEQLGHVDVDANIVEANEREALWLAAQANLNHGLPLKSREVRRVFKACIRARKHCKKDGLIKSYREMGAEIGKGHTTIRSWMMKDFPRIARAMGGNEEFVGDGGLQDAGRPVGPLHETLTKLDEAMTSFASMSDPDARGEVITRAETMLEDMKASGDWRPPDF